MLRGGREGRACLGSGSGRTGGQDEGGGEGEAAEHHDAEQRHHEVGGPQGLGTAAVVPQRLLERPCGRAVLAATVAR